MTVDQRLLPQIKAYVEDFAASCLAEYNQRLAKPGGVRKGDKEVNDPVWGTIKLSPLEVVILDSPLNQRLRFVRQLGVVHWVYPGAGHTRLEHTLGVLHQTQQLINAINHASGQPATDPPIDDNRAALVRLCAILHDIGHPVFSHVSEHSLAKRGEVRRARSDFIEEHKIEKAQLSEIVAFYIVGSPSFKETLAIALDQLARPINYGNGAAADAEYITGLIQSAIIGRMIDEEVPLLHEIITGPFDADKLDYYVRDAFHAGVPSLVDISRLTQKIAVKKVRQSELPHSISEKLSGKTEWNYLFGLKWSGASILDELHLARVLLYAKIYRHKKVQAIEAMIDALYEALASCAKISSLDLIDIAYRFTDDQFIWSSCSDLLEKIGKVEPTGHELSFVNDILKRLRSRDLFVSALGIRAKYPSDPWFGDEMQEAGLADLVGDLANVQRMNEFKRDLIEEVLSLYEVVPSAFGGLGIDFVKMSIVVSAKPALGGSTEIERAFVLQGNQMILGRDLDRINKSAWSQAYDFGAPSAMVFCPRECSAAVYIASEKIIRRKYGVVLPSSALEISKQRSDDVIAIKREAETKGWYASAPFDIRAMPARLTRADVEGRVEAIAKILSSIDEPDVITEQRRPADLKERTLSWLSQFRSDEMIECAMVALENLKVVRRKDTKTALAEFLKANPEFEGAIVCPFGTEKDSGTVQAYMSLDLPGIRGVMSIKDAAESNKEGPVIFLDDFIGSGAQGSTIVGTWFEKRKLVKDELEEERLPFSSVEQDYLQKQKIGFVFVAGWQAGVRELQTAVDDLGLDAIVYAHLTDADLPFLDAIIESQFNKKRAGEFEAACRKIGEELQKSAGKTGKKVSERALGYGNRGMLVATGFNVPTQTLTGLWRDGKVEGVDWHALIRRRPKN